MKKLFFPLVFLFTFLYSTVVCAAGQVNNVRVGVHTKEHLRIVVDASEPVYYDVATKDKVVEVSIEAVKAENIATTKRPIASNQVGNSFQVTTKGKHTVVRLDLHQPLEAKNITDFVLRKGGNGSYRIVVDVFNRNGIEANSVSTAVQTAPKAVPAATVQTEPKATPAAAKATVQSKPVVSSRPTVSSSPIKRSEGEQQTAVVKEAPKMQETPKVVAKQEAPKVVAKQETSKPVAVKEKTTDGLKKPAIKTTGTVKKPVVKKNEPKPVLSKDGKYTILKTDEGEPYYKSTKAFKTNGGIKGKLVAIDPGHGGSDPGAIGKGGTQEKAVTLQIAMKVKENLEKAGAKVVMTRTADKDVTSIPYDKSSDADELQARVNIAEKNNADILISIHNNSLGDRKVGGICTYYYSKTNNDSRLATNIQTKLGKGFKLRDMGIRQANFYMVKRCSMPAALIELCFISNAQEEKLLKNSWFQKKSAKLISEAVDAYFK